MDYRKGTWTFVRFNVFFLFWISTLSVMLTIFFKVRVTEGNFWTWYEIPPYA